MKLCLFLITIRLLTPLGSLYAAGEATNQKPNIVIILLADLGSADLGCQGSTD